MTGVEQVRIPTALGEVVVHLRGSGPLAVLLHANPGESGDFDAVVDHLAERMTVAAVDWPGYGQSPAREPRAVTAPALADALGPILAALLDRVDQPRAVLVGNSVGGYAAVRQALDHPQRVRALVLIAPGGFTRHTPITRLACRMMGTPRLAAKLAGPLASLYTWRRTATSRQALRRAYAVGRNPSRLELYCAIWRSFLDPAHDLRDRASQLAVPTLLTWGWGDPVLPRLSDGRRTARMIANSTVRTFVCGHEPHAETPAAWLQTVTSFLGALREIPHGTGTAGSPPPDADEPPTDNRSTRTSHGKTP